MPINMNTVFLRRHLRFFMWFERRKTMQDVMTEALRIIAKVKHEEELWAQAEEAGYTNEFKAMYGDPDAKKCATMPLKRWVEGGRHAV